MEKATGGRTQHGRRPSPRLSVRPEHSVQAGAGRAQAGPRAAPQAPPALEWGAGTALERLGEMFQQNDLLCIFKGILSIFLHCPPSFAFRSGLTPGPGGEMLLQFHVQELIWNHGVQQGMSSKGGVNTGNQGCAPPEDGQGLSFSALESSPSPGTPGSPELGQHPGGSGLVWGCCAHCPSPCPTWVPWISTCLRQSCLLADALKTHLDLGFTLTM